MLFRLLQHVPAPSPHLMMRDTMMYNSSSQLGRGSVSAHVASMWYGNDAFKTNTNSEPPNVTSFSSRITREDVKSGVNLKQNGERGTSKCSKDAAVITMCSIFYFLSSEKGKFNFYTK